MVRKLVEYFLLLISAVCLLGTAFPNSTLKMPLSGSRWSVGKHSIAANIDLNELLFSKLNGIKERHYNYASGSDDQLQQIATEFIQPYINKKISISVNGRTYPVNVDRLVRHDNAIYTIWLSINDIAFDRPQNVLKITYKILFDETKNQHVNQAYFYRSDATGCALQKLFDNYPAERVRDFTGNSPTWELSIKGTAAAPGSSVVQKGEIRPLRAPGGVN